MGIDMGLSHLIESPLIESMKMLHMGSVSSLINVTAESGSYFLVTDAITSVDKFVIE